MDLRLPINGREENIRAQRDAFDPETIRLQREGSGPPLVLLHCLGADHRLWGFAGQGLPGDFTVIRYDFPGHGETPVPGGRYGIEDLSTQLGAILDRAGIGRVCLAGISLGGVVAQHFAATMPERIDKLVLIDTAPRHDERLRQMWIERSAAARAHGVQSFAATLLRFWFTDRFIAGNPPAVRYARETLERCPREGYALACEALAAADVAELVPRIRAPTLVICGSDDVPAFRGAARWLVDTIPGARGAWLVGARHCSVLEQPELFLGVLRDFLGGGASARFRAGEARRAARSPR
jgi:3-oxoadipate enol-lactonase